MLNQVKKLSRHVKRTGCSAQKVLFALHCHDVTFLSTSATAAKLKDGAVLSVCFERGGKISPSSDVAFISGSKDRVLEVNETLNLVATLYQDAKTDQYLPKKGKFMLRELVKNKFGSGSTYVGLAVAEIHLEQFVSVDEIHGSKEVSLLLDKIAVARITITSQVISPSGYDIDDTMSVLSSASDISDVFSSVGASFEYNDAYSYGNSGSGSSGGGGGSPTHATLGLGLGGRARISPTARGGSFSWGSYGQNQDNRSDSSGSASGRGVDAALNNGEEDSIDGGISIIGNSDSTVWEVNPMGGPLAKRGLDSQSRPAGRSSFRITPISTSTPATAVADGPGASSTTPAAAGTTDANVPAVLTSVSVEGGAQPLSTKELHDDQGIRSALAIGDVASSGVETSVVTAAAAIIDESMDISGATSTVPITAGSQSGATTEGVVSVSQVSESETAISHASTTAVTVAPPVIDTSAALYEEISALKAALMERDAVIAQLNKELSEQKAQDELQIASLQQKLNETKTALRREQLGREAIAAAHLKADHSLGAVLNQAQQETADIAEEYAQIEVELDVALEQLEQAQLQVKTLQEELADMTQSAREAATAATLAKMRRHEAEEENETLVEELIATKVKCANYATDYEEEKRKNIVEMRKLQKYAERVAALEVQLALQAASVGTAAVAVSAAAPAAANAVTEAVRKHRSESDSTGHDEASGEKKEGERSRRDEDVAVLVTMEEKDGRSTDEL